MPKRFGKIQAKAYGVTYDKRQNKLWNVRKYTSKGYPITTMLRHEPNNERDPHAVAVLVQTDATVAKVGYLPADQAFWVSQNGQRTYCPCYQRSCHRRCRWFQNPWIFIHHLAPNRLILNNTQSPCYICNRGPLALRRNFYA